MQSRLDDQNNFAILKSRLNAVAISVLKPRTCLRHPTQRNAQSGLLKMSAKMSITKHNRQYLENGDVDDVRQAILSRYHERINRYRKNTGISYPYVRANCVNDDPKSLRIPMSTGQWL